jgi:ring-1,2-phenylacetyl-CoA epoxidase subunit PaaB
MSAGTDLQAEGGHGAVPTAGVPATSPSTNSQRDWPLWEVFVRAKRGLSHQHVGSLHAPDAAMALRNARDIYTRRSEGVSIWVVPAAEVVASSPDEKDSFFDPAADKAYRHPTFYVIPDEVQHL